jgi:hypothetical protein
MTEKFPTKLARATKRSRGRTMVESTPVTIRGSLLISPMVEDRMRRKLVRRLGHAAPLIERGTVRFEDMSGTRGGLATECRIKLVLSGRPSVQAQNRGRDAEIAFDGASFKVQRALASVRGKHSLTAGKHMPSRRGHSPTVEASKRAAVAARSGSPPERAPMKLETARRAPSRKAVKHKARRARHRIGMQRARHG